jgi:hypothetical protein
MLKLIFQLGLMTLSLAQRVNAQSFDQLTALKGHTAGVYYSAGHEQRATAIAQRLGKAMGYYTEMLGFRPAVTLLVLSASDWSKHAIKGMVYGMPHYDPSGNKLVVAGEDNPFWKGFLPPPDQLPEPLRNQVQAAYQNSEGNLSMQPFFDLLAIHELGHAFHIQRGLTIQRQWMGELFVNILLHTYVAENEPELLPALTTFPRMVIAAGAREFKHTSLQDIEERYEEIGRDYPKNYGWYQCRWHAAAAAIYDAGGKQAGITLWNALQSRKEKLTDEQLVSLLSSTGNKGVIDMMQNWDQQSANP